MRFVRLTVLLFFSFEWYEILESYGKTRLYRLIQWLPKWGELPVR